MTAGWWTRQIGQRVAPPSPPGWPFPPSSPPQAPAGAPPPSAAPASAPAPPAVAPQPGDPHGHLQRTMAWQGGDGARELATVGACPNCGSPRYFARAFGAVTTPNGVMLPRPVCSDCGYPQHQGALNTGAAQLPAQVTSAVTPSRQGAAPVPGTLESLRG